jgi:hypothetical protein
MVIRVVEVPAERIVGWVERYAATHPGTVASVRERAVRLETDAGATALLTPLLPFAAEPGTAADALVAALAAHAERPTVTALILVRRGGYAVGVARGTTLERSKVGTRYVQSRTAAGGWSQQRFARRRDGQTRDLVRAAAQAWSDLPLRSAAGGSGGVLQPVVLVTGGDRTLCEQVLAEASSKGLRALGSARHLDVIDPRLAVLQDAAVRAQSLVVTIHEP